MPRGPTRVGRFPGWLIAAASVFVVLLAVAWVAPSLIGSTSPEEAGGVGGVQSVPSATPAGSPAAATQGPSAEPAPSEPAPTVGSNAAPGTIDVGASKLIAWQDEFGEIRAHIVVVAQNPGGTPIAVAASQSRWHVVDDAGAPFASGRFAHAFPPIVKPGGSVLLIETLSATFGETDEVRGLEVEIGTEPAEAAEPVATLDVAGVTWREAPDGGLEVTGRVTNTGDAAVRDAAVAVVLRDATGEIVGGAYDVGLGALEAGAVANFATSYPGTPPIDPATVANAEAVAIGVP